MEFSEIRRRPTGALPVCTGLHPVLRRVYAARGVVSGSDLDLSLERLLPVGSLPGVQEAAELLMEHRPGRVLVIGDFDADGATSSALMLRALRALNFGHVDFLVPNRFKFGYGLTPEIVALYWGSHTAADIAAQQAWFAGWAPAEDPEIAIVVLVEHGGAGGQVAWPIAKQIFEGYYTGINGRAPWRDGGHPMSPPPRDMPAVKRVSQ